MFVYVRVPESQPPSTMEFFLKKPCLVPHILKTTELNQKRLKNLLTNFLCSFQIRKDSLSDIGTLKGACAIVYNCPTDNYDLLIDYR